MPSQATLPGGSKVTQAGCFPRPQRRSGQCRHPQESGNAFVISLIPQVEEHIQTCSWKSTVLALCLYGKDKALRSRGEKPLQNACCQKRFSFQFQRHLGVQFSFLLKNDPVKLLKEKFCKFWAWVLAFVGNCLEAVTISSHFLRKFQRCDKESFRLQAQYRSVGALSRVMSRHGYKWELQNTCLHPAHQERLWQCSPPQ